MAVWFYSLVSVFGVSIISLIGVTTLNIKRETLNKIIFALISLAAGTLLGDAFIHIIPESFHHLESELTVSLLVLGGVLMFFVLEKFIRWHHCHDTDCTHGKHHLASLNIVGDAVHNFVDGMLIAASYMASIPLGVATTIAVVLHEIPQEIGDFGVLIYSGMKLSKALLMNFLAAVCAVFGALIVLIIGQHFHEIAHYLIPITAGGFVYIACSDLIPELHQEIKWRSSLIQVLFLIIGIAIMYSLVFFTHQH